jgi:RimJ/RimL family protein N-acetyltransferase
VEKESRVKAGRQRKAGGMTTVVPKPRLVGDRVTLRAAIASDAAARLALGRDPEIVHMFGGNPDTIAPMSEQMAQNWLNDQIDHATAWVIEVDKKCVGAIRLHSIDKADERADLAVAVLDPNLLGQGLGTEAIHLMLGHAFGAMQLHRVSLRVIEYNERAIAAYKKVGFVEEGRERDAGFVQGQRYDDVIMGVLAPEYRGRHERVH